jgi:hypothetical protein
MILMKAMLAEHTALCMKTKEEIGLMPGPWDNEPHRVDFKAYGLNCLLLRNPLFWNWCGYVGVPPGHPAYGKSISEINQHACAYGGITSVDEIDGLYWIGFDCAHETDLVPCLETARIVLSKPSMQKTYKDVNFVKDEAEYFAEGLHEMKWLN